MSGDFLFTRITDDFTNYGSNSNLARSHNERVIVYYIQKFGLLNRKQISEVTKLSTPTVSTITAELIENGVLKVVGRNHGGGRGQPPIDLSLNPNYLKSIGLEVHRNIIDGIRIDFSGKVEKKLALPLVLQESNNPKVLSSLLPSENEVQSKNFQIGLAINNQNMSDENWKQTQNVLSHFQDSTKCTFITATHSQCATIAETSISLKNETDFKNTLYIWLGKTLNSTIILNGNIYFGKSGFAGEALFRGVQAKFSNSQLNNGQSSTHLDLENLLSLQTLSSLIKAKITPDWSIDKFPEINDGHEELITVWLASAADEMMPHIIHMAKTLDIENVVIGSGLPSNYTNLLSQELHRSYLNYQKLYENLKITAASQGPDAVVLGAAYLPIYQTYSPNQDRLMSA